MSNGLTALELAIQTNTPTIWWDEPGVGKSWITEGIAAALEWPCETFVLSICEPSDIGGLPFANSDGEAYRRLIPARLRNLIEATERHNGGILFLDELNTAPPATQATALRLCQQDRNGIRWLGDEPLPPALRIVAASNPVELSAGGFDLAPPLANRFYHHTGRPSTEAWCKALRLSFRDSIPLHRLPYNWADRIGTYAAYVSSFITARPALLQQVPKANSDQGKAWPSRRTWHTASRLLAASHGLPDTQADLLTGTVGPGAAAEFMAWFTHADLPSPELCLKNPAKYIKAPKPDEEHRLFAIMASACSYVREHPTPDLWSALWALTIHISQWAPDVVFAFVIELAYELRPLIQGPTPVPDAGKALLKRVGKDIGITGG